MSSENLYPAMVNQDQLRFLRYRLEVIRRWGASDEKRTRMQAIEAAIESLGTAGGSVLSPHHPWGERGALHGSLRASS